MRILNYEDLRKQSKQTFLDALQYLSTNRIASAWCDEREIGWQELWSKSQFSGLYATSNALRLLAIRASDYTPIIKHALKEMEYVYDDSIDYTIKPDDDEDTKKQKSRCAYLLSQNHNITLKAVYFLDMYYDLASVGHIVQKGKFDTIVQKVLRQLESVYDSNTGVFWPAVDNVHEVSLLTTMKAFVLMQNDFLWGKHSEKTKKSIQFFLDLLKSVNLNKSKDKFETYKQRCKAITSIYALSKVTDCLTKEQIDTVAEGFLSCMQDAFIREGFKIRDSYAVPRTVTATDTYVSDAKMLFLNAALTLIKNRVLSFSYIEYFLDDFIEIVETTQKMQCYMNWDMSPSFSYNCDALHILNLLYENLEARKNTHNLKAQQILHIQPSTFPTIPYRSIEEHSVVLFMPFTREYSDSFRKSVREVLSYVGFDVWWATNDPYGAIVVDNIWTKLNKARFVIVDCSGRSVNVMYEIGLTHALGKKSLLCGQSEDDFPFECAYSDDGYRFARCVYNNDGEQNPPPYRDLQRGIVEYMLEHLDEMSISPNEEERMRERLVSFKDKYLSR